MKFSYSWIQELVPGLDTAPEALARLITMRTAECEAVQAVGKLLGSLSIARVISAEPIGGESHNQRVVVETERYGVKTVVCGAPNCRPGLITAYVPLMAITIEGIESDGMLASGAELEINRDHSGVLDLTEAQASSLRLRPDHIIEVDNKSLTHRPDLWGHYGMAREVAAIEHKKLLDPVQLDLIPGGDAPIQVVIDDFALCPRYSALVFDNVTVEPSPLWLQYRLEAIGLNAINNIVDVTNLVMSELAQPMHAFDAGRLKGETIRVRPARPGESIVALNEVAYDLTPSNLVIADARDPIAIAGVIGGLESAIDARTTRIVLESANFQASSVRKTSAQLKLRTDASMRFEKSQDPVNTVRGLARAVELLRQVSPGIRIVGGLASSGAPLKQTAPVEVSIGWLSRKLGRSTSGSEVRSILESLHFGVTETGVDSLSVTIPSWRATKDISMKDDILEEIGRMIGYDSITPAAPLVASAPPPQNPERAFHRDMRRMVAAQGFTEVFNYSFVSEEMARMFDLDPASHVHVTNPIGSGQTLMRRSLLPGIWRNIEENSKHLQNFRLFEIGREIHPDPGKLPNEVPHLMAAVFAREGDGSAGLFELSRLAGCLLPGIQIESSVARAYEHPQRAAELRAHGETVGRLFELHPKLDLAGRAAILDLDLARLQTLSRRDVKFEPLRRFPTSAFDLSIIAPLREPVARTAKLLAQSAGEALLTIDFVRQYTGAPLPEDRKSVSYRLTVGARDRTLPPGEQAEIRSRIIDALRAAGYELRI